MLITVNDLLTAKGLLLKAGTVVDATLIAAPTSTKKKDKKKWSRKFEQFFKWKLWG